MVYTVFFSLAVLVCQVYSQVCSPPILPPLPTCSPTCLPAPCLPPINPCTPTSLQVINPNPYVTTIIDNSVSNALANALQLLIVSNLIGATVGNPTPCVNNLGPLLDSIICPNPCVPVDIIPEYVPCVPNYDIIPCNPYCSNVEFLSPCVCDYPSPYCGLTEVYSPYCAYTDTITPFYGNCIDNIPIFNGYVESIPTLYSIDTYNPNFCGCYPDIITNYFNYPTEICPNYYNGLETPIVQFTPNMYGGLTEIVAPAIPPYPLYGVEGVAPLGALAPNYFGGLTEIPSVPLATEVVIPSTIPGNLNCNFGYPPSLPCVRLNVDPLPYEPCNGYGGPIYY